ncbi:MAG TPA: outer membrane protein assembly factor BamE [Fluviicoccus sp.]|nr:outer membrane protein assembly factor BamE [Fluviicoccus sp.]
MRQKLKVALFCSLSLLGGCNALHVYTIDLPQGNPISRETASKLKTGMTPAQVRYVLGSPMVSDPLNSDRWDYIYTFKPGTYARQAGVKPVTRQHLVLRFTDGRLSAIEGLDTLPEKAQEAIPSRDRGLNAEPL